MERIIPNLNSSLLIPIIPHKSLGNLTESDYISYIEIFERKCEKSLIETLSKIDIKGLVKTNPYSLPFTDEITVTLNGESYLNGAYEFYRVARKFIKELLDKNLYKIRFYIVINVIVPEKLTLLNSFGKVEYKLRYYNK